MKDGAILTLHTTLIGKKIMRNEWDLSVFEMMQVNLSQTITFYQKQKYWL
jgi:hypothetical protein